MIHLPLLVGQLACAVARCLVDHIGRLHLEVAALACLLEEESLEGALQAGHLADVDGETGPGDFHTHVEVYEVELLAEVPVAQGVGRQFGYHAAFLDHHVVGSVLALGHVVVGHVGDGAQQVMELLLGVFHGFL